MQNKKLYNPFVLAILLIINILWIYSIVNYSNLNLGKAFLINIPLITGVAIYLLGYIQFLKFKSYK